MIPKPSRLQTTKTCSPHSWYGLLSIAAWCSLLLGIGSCTKTRGDRDLSGTPENQAEEVKSANVQGQSAAAASKQPVIKTLRYARSSDPRYLDPQAQFDTVSSIFVKNIYDTLLNYAYLKTPFELEPGLLEEMPTLVGENLYQLKLRKGITFHDDVSFTNGKGRELTADDVIYTFKRFADLKVNKSSYFLLRGQIQGLDALHEASKKAKKGEFDYDQIKVAGLKKIDDHTLTVQLTGPSSSFLFALASTSLSIVPKEAVEHYGRQFKNHPVGTGPFTLEKFKKKQTMVLKRNPNYWGRFPTTASPSLSHLLKDKAGSVLPLVDRVEISLIAELQPRVLSFQKGSIDFITALDRDNFKAMTDRNEKGQFVLKKDLQDQFNLRISEGVASTFIYFNMRNPLLAGNKKLRQAMAHAVDKQEFAMITSGGLDQPLSHPVPNAIKDSARMLGIEGRNFDIEKAKKLLAEAGYPEGKGLPVFTVDLRGNSTAYQRIFEVLRSGWDQIGIKVTPRMQTWTNYLRSMDTGNFEIADSGWSADYPDAENFLSLFDSQNIGSNNTAFKNPEYDRLFQQVRSLPIGPERSGVIRQLYGILDEEVPVIPVTSKRETSLSQKWITSFYYNAMLDMDFKYYDIDMSLRKER